MKKLSETYNELGIDFTFPIEIKDEKGRRTYYENSDGDWARIEYDDRGNRTYYESSDGFWSRLECDERCNDKIMSGMDAEDYQ